MELLINPVECKIIEKGGEETKTAIFHYLDQFGIEQSLKVIVPSSTDIRTFGCDVID